ncbi:MAG TPA: chemotaxis response regulator protein-glutamate methylesterase [Clostridiales bacterium]|nr:chemotaxis response regulator protein-glutamate methylesterase [Clostridiales bacterium]
MQKTASNKVKVLVVDDSLFFRNIIQKLLENHKNIEVIAVCNDAIEAEKKLKEITPDVITCDVEMPVVGGIEFVKKIMSQNPIPILLVSAVSISIFDALHSGAVDFVKKPNIRNTNDVSRFVKELTDKILVASRANVRRKEPKILKPAADSPVILENQRQPRMVIAIGASTGGTEATTQILQQLSRDIPGIVIVQHMPAGFTHMYAERLNKICNIRVAEAQDGDRITCGTALIAPGERHIIVKKDSRGFYVRCIKGDKVSGHCPSVDMLFKSVAASAGKNAVGIILTGMGKDGAEGLLEMKRQGAYTIGQDEETSVVYGMPMAAYNIGAVTKQLPLHKIAADLVEYINSVSGMCDQI